MTADGDNKVNKKREQKSLPKPFVSKNLLTKLPIASLATRDSIHEEKPLTRPDVKMNFDLIEADRKAADEKLLKFQKGVRNHEKAITNILSTSCELSSLYKHPKLMG